VAFEPARGCSAAVLETQLRPVHTLVENVFANPGPSNQLNSYLKWVADSERILNFVARQADIDRLLLTRRYWSILANPEPSAANMAAVSEHVMPGGQMLRREIAELNVARRRWDSGHPETVFVLADTNVYIQHQQELPSLNWREAIDQANLVNSTVRLVVPILVIDGLDNLKRNPKTKSRARTTLKLFYDHFRALAVGDVGACTSHAEHRVDPRAADARPTRPRASSAGRRRTRRSGGLFSCHTSALRFTSSPTTQERYCGHAQPASSRTALRTCSGPPLSDERGNNVAAALAGRAPHCSPVSVQR
jgi:hypothetical protein